MKILVTGGCGFIGSHIVDAYVGQGHDVAVIDDLSTGTIENLNPKAKFYEEDICGNIERIFQKEEFEMVNHHAAQINVRTSVEDPLFDARVNVLGTLNLLQLATRFGVKRFVYASSGGAVYGEPAEYPIKEIVVPRPLSPYGASKTAAEKYIVTYSNLYDLQCVILRYSNVYGPRQIIKSEAGVISIFIDRILRNEPCTVFGDGKQVRDYVYVGDVVEANVSALACQPNIFNIGTGVETSVNDLIDVFSSILNKDIAHEHVAPRPGEVFRNGLEYSKASSEIGWQPKIQINAGILKTFEYFKEIFKS